MNFYAISDLHGRYDLLEEILKFIKKDDRIFFLGDAIDRGPDGIKIIQYLMQDPRFCYIKGNHEDLMVEAIINPRAIYKWNLNGNENTYKDFIALKEKQQQIIAQYLANLPLVLKYTNLNKQTFILTHAGYTPDKPSFCHDLLWDRTHIQDTWEENQFDFIVHGHTPVQFLNSYFLNKPYDDNNISNPKIVKYANGHKIDIDMGSAFSDTIVLFNLDTWEEKYFSVKSL